MYSTKHLEKLEALETNAPAAMKAFREFDQAALAAGAISRKHKELMAFAVAFTTQCPYCIGIHAGAAISHGTHAIA